MASFQNPSTSLAKKSSERNGLSNFGRGSPEEHSWIIIAKSIHCLRRRIHLNVFLFLAQAAILFNEAERFGQFW